MIPAVSRPVVSLAVYLLVGWIISASVALAEEETADSPFTVEPEMVRWARHMAGRSEAPESILDRLAAAVGRGRRFGLRETELETGTAREVFRSRRANCAGFAFLVIGLARSLGVEALVVDVTDVVRGERRAGFAIRHRHLAVGVWTRGRLHVVDREGVLSPIRHQLLVLEDRTAAAIYHSHRGAEMLLAGHLDEALVHLRRALEIDPRLEAARGNLKIARGLM